MYICICPIVKCLKKYKSKNYIVLNSRQLSNNKYFQFFSFSSITPDNYIDFDLFHLLLNNHDQLNFQFVF